MSEDGVNPGQIVQPGITVWLLGTPVLVRQKVNRKNIFFFCLISYSCVLNEADLAEGCGGEDVPVAHGGHGDHHPVDAGGDGREAALRLLLDEEAQTGEDYPRDQDQHQHQAELAD